MARITLRRAFQIILFIFTAIFFVVVKHLVDRVEATHGDHKVEAPAAPPLAGSFQPVRLDSRIVSSAASGLAILPAPDSNKHFLAVANFYGSSSLYELNADAAGLAPRFMQSFSTKAAHDWEVVALPGGRLQLVAAEYDATRSLVYELNATGTTLKPPEPLPGWPDCGDTDPNACANWASSGECTRNPGFMHSSCPSSCGKCNSVFGPLVAVQLLPGLGGTTARHLRLPDKPPPPIDPQERDRMKASATSSSTLSTPMRDFLLVANYKSPSHESVAVYEWTRKWQIDATGYRSRSSRWELFGYLDAAGTGEFTHCRIPGATPSSEQHLIIASTWNVNGSFAASSLVYSFNTHGVDVTSTFVLRQAIGTSGSHDAECFTTGSGETYLLLANGRRDDNTRDVPSKVYRYDRTKKFFVSHQSISTVGCHDIELITLPPPPPPRSGAKQQQKPTILALVANGASFHRREGRVGDKHGKEADLEEEACDNPSVEVYRWEEERRFFHRIETWEANGCATYVKAWRTVPPQSDEHGGTRILVAVAIERTATEGLPAAKQTTPRVKGGAPKADSGTSGGGSYDASVLVYEWQWHNQ
jgi:hypothetical protein